MLCARRLSRNLADESLFRDVRHHPAVPRVEKTRHRERQINLRRRAGYARTRARLVLYKRIYIVPTVPGCHNRT